MLLKTPMFLARVRVLREWVRVRVLREWVRVRLLLLLLLKKCEKRALIVIKRDLLRDLLMALLLLLVLQSCLLL